MHKTNIYTKSTAIVWSKKIPKYIKKCEHNKRRTRCHKCKGASICEHDRIRAVCKKCNGKSICEHNRFRPICRECRGTSICEHNRRRCRCKQCNGTSICSHNQYHQFCKTCKGTSICEHNIRRCECITCSANRLLQCTFTMCDYKTKVKNNYKNHIKIHSTEYIRNCKQEEVKVQKLLSTNDINHTREHTITYGCVNDINNTNSRVDFVIEHTDINDKFGLIFLEVDEHQHNGYPISCDVSRMAKIIESLMIDGNIVPIRFLRYNPHCYSINNIKQKINQVQRHDKLIECIKTVEFNTSFSVMYLFYDMENGKPCIFDDYEYTESFKQFVLLHN